MRLVRSEEISMNTSSKGIALIQAFEGFRATAYKDIAGIWTIGYGTIVINGRPVKAGEICTTEQAIGYLYSDLRAFEAAIQREVKIPLLQHQFDALACFAYNVGVGALKASTLLKNINARLPIEERRFTDWNKAKINGVLTASPGLTRRRKSEYYLFTTGLIKTNF
jgi:lysozyme